MELTSDLAAVCLTRPDLIVHACQKVGDEFTARVLCADALLTRCGRAQGGADDHCSQVTMLKAKNATTPPLRLVSIVLDSIAEEDVQPHSAERARAA